MVLPRVEHVEKNCKKPRLYDRIEAEVREMMGRRSRKIGMQIVDVEMMIAGGIFIWDQIGTQTG